MCICGEGALGVHATILGCERHLKRQKRRRKQRGNRRTLLSSCVWTVVWASISSFVPNWSETWKMREIEYHWMKLKIIISFTRFKRFWFLHNLVQFHDEINDMYIYIYIWRVLVLRSRDVVGINLIDNCFRWKKQISPPLYSFASSHLILSPIWGKTGRFNLFVVVVNICNQESLHHKPTTPCQRWRLC